MRLVIVIVIGVLVLLCLGGAGIVAGMFLASSTASPTEVMVEPSPLPLPTQAAQPIPTQPPVNNEQVFTITESDLNQQLTQNMPPDGEATNVRLDLHEGNTANVSATLRVNSSLTLQPNALIRFGVANGRVTMDVVQVKVGGFGVPSSMIEPQINALKTNAENELNKQLTAYQDSTGMKLQAVSTTEDSLTLQFAP